jgi:hypothetical protein
VTAAGVAALTLQDGRIAITTDTQRLFHLKATGAVELGYIPLSGTAGNVTFGLVTSSLGFALSGNGTYASAKVYKDATNGLILSGTTGATYDLVLTNNSGSPVIRILTGTLNVTCPGTFTAVNLSATGFLAVGGTVAATGSVRLANGFGINWRNAGNSGDVAGIYVSAAITHVDAETSISLDKIAQFTKGSGVGQMTSAAFTVLDAAASSGVLYNNILLRLSSQGSGADTTLQFTDNVTYNAFISAKANIFSFNVAASTPVTFDVNGINSIGLSLADDQSKKLNLARYSGATPWSYIKIPASASGFRITNAAATVDVMILDNAGSVVFTGNAQFDGRLDVAGSAVAVAAGYLSLGGNTSTTANTYGGGGVSALPAQPRGYIPIYLGATNFKIPYYVA